MRLWTASSEAGREFLFPVAWTFDPPPQTSPGAETCVTVSGGTAGAPDVAIVAGDGQDIKPSSIKSKGNGVFVICFRMPATSSSVTITVSGGGCSSPTFQNL